MSPVNAVTFLQNEALWCVFSWIQFFLGFSLRMCFMKLCPSPGSAGKKWQWALASQESSIHGTWGWSTEADSNEWKLLSSVLKTFCTGTWCWTATTADLVTGNCISVTQTHHSTWGEEKNPWRRRGSNPLVFSSKIKVSSLSKVDTEDLLLCILSLII